MPETPAGPSSVPPVPSSTRLAQFARTVLSLQLEARSELRQWMQQHIDEAQDTFGYWTCVEVVDRVLDRLPQETFEWFATTHPAFADLNPDRTPPLDPDSLVTVRVRDNLEDALVEFLDTEGPELLYELRYQTPGPQVM